MTSLKMRKGWVIEAETKHKQVNINNADAVESFSCVQKLLKRNCLTDLELMSVMSQNANGGRLRCTYLWLISVCYDFTASNFPIFRSQVFMPHQWLEGNLPVSARCVVCDKNCGSVRRLQDWRCLWCKAIVSGIVCGVRPVITLSCQISVCTYFGTLLPAGKLFSV